MRVENFCFMSEGIIMEMEGEGEESLGRRLEAQEFARVGDAPRDGGGCCCERRGQAGA